MLCFVVNDNIVIEWCKYNCINTQIPVTVLTDFCYLFDTLEGGYHEYIYTDIHTGI